jgi:hypothetical protein
VSTSATTASPRPATRRAKRPRRSANGHRRAQRIKCKFCQKWHVGGQGKEELKKVAKRSVTKKWKGGEMRVDTPYGPVWLYPDTLPMKAAMQGARLDLLWPDLNGFSAMHTGSGDEGAWVVRAPLAALERTGYRTDSAAEYPVKEGTVWPPTHIKFTFAPPITPEQLYNQDKRKQ